MIQRKGGTAPGDPPIGFGSRRLLLAPRREKARGRLRLPAARLRGAATPQLCAPAARRPAPPPAGQPRPLAGQPRPLPAPRGPAPLLERSAGGRGAGAGAQDRSAARCPPPGNPLGARIRGPALSRTRRRCRSGPPARAAPALRLPLAAPNFVPGDKPLSAPGAAPARPKPPPPAGHRERGAPGHLTARRVNQRPPSAPSLPAAAGPALGWPGAGRPRAALGVRSEKGWMPRTNTIPFIKIIPKCESRPHSRQTG